MFSVTALYPKTADSHFDMEYYLHKHIPLVKERLTPMGLTIVHLETGLAGATPDSPPAFVMIGHLKFNTIEEIQAALATHGPELWGDIANFTDAQPVMQINLTV